MRCGVPVVAIVLNNNCWGSEKPTRNILQSALRRRRPDQPALRQVRRAVRRARLLRRAPGDIGNAVNEALKANVPSVIEIPVDPEALEQPAREMR